ncbi:hypothetical protein [Vibrio penaeicida]|uniref:Uncharacterized protein n=1 Tax=Vibrio penaeicida TaxID=104609 RepID=A0AAV5NP93_9VIBR|nr:hypothetical protein [Vibrio penaeicida]RTZ20792.1 hypothetical protein EKN09_22705 [Vibrio penaeicida]GLQ72328.1 hypothetical protein GCM10007932_16880 [Vibrio penaeicida]
MKNKAVLLISLTLSTAAYADVTIQKNRVVCETNASMQKFVKRKAVKKNAQLPDGCRVLERKRKVEVLKNFPSKGYVLVETKLGDKLFVSKEALSR